MRFFRESNLMLSELFPDVLSRLLKYKPPP